MGTHTSLKRTQDKEVQIGAGAEMEGNRAHVSKSRQWSILCLEAVISSLLKYGCVGWGVLMTFVQ